MSVNHRYLQKSVQVAEVLQHFLQAWVLQEMKHSQKANRHNVKLNGKRWEKAVNSKGMGINWISKN